ncbi:CYFA0S06e01200g1_1 [Cyberlindnera fabianii]|uniref:Vacuolar protein sorting-associated protein 29 n=1 Tax=Cyberlindnera fabianii TaxID=36022 RepID=A0A061B247_CYBFA|nr:CYFA0S06e01200g1_1 [Cyberlindnera fabianii]
MLVLAIGDLHIPQRAIFKKLLVPGKISQVLCLGNATTSPSTLEFLKNLSADFQIVRGEFDDNSSLPLSLVITHGPLRIGFTNGFTIVPRGDPLSLLTMARQMNVDVLIWGGTHKVEAYALEGKFFVNPGSATGAFTTEWPDVDLDEDEKKEGEETEDKEENEDKKEDPDKEDKEEEAKEEEDGNDDDDEAEETNDIIPSFTLLDVQGSVITLYIYTYINGDVKVDKVSYRKDQ